MKFWFDCGLKLKRDLGVCVIWMEGSMGVGMNLNT